MLGVHTTCASEISVSRHIRPTLENPLCRMQKPAGLAPYPEFCLHEPNLWAAEILQCRGVTGLSQTSFYRTNNATDVLPP